MEKVGRPDRPRGFTRVLGWLTAIGAWGRSWRTVRDAPVVMGRMVQPSGDFVRDPRQPGLGWPTGVQEDDDARWGWEEGPSTPPGPSSGEGS